MRSKYTISLVLALAFGVGLAFWRATDEFSLRVQAATHLAAVAQLAAEERASALGEKLDQEIKARETAERAWKKVANRAADLGQQLIEQIGTTRKLEASLAGVENKLKLANEKISSQIAARKEVQAEHYNANAQVGTLSTTLQQESASKEGAGAGRTKAAAEAKAVTEKVALEIKREAASKVRPAQRRASPDRRHKIAVRRQNQKTALQPAKKHHPAWWPIPPVQ